MKKILLLSALFASLVLRSQDVVIGNGSNLLAHGNLIVSQSLKSPTNAPTAAQTKTMVNGSTIQFTNLDSTGRVFDPGGNGNYAANQSGVCVIDYGYQTAYEITLEDVDLRSGDSLVINSVDAIDHTTSTILSVGNGYSTAATFIIDNLGFYASLQINFKSDADAAVGRGFRLLFKRMYAYYSPLPAKYPSMALLYNSSLGALRSGYTGTQPMGYYSAAFGSDNVAGGYASLAAGYGSNAAGFGSVALGYYSSAAGYGAAAVGGYRSYARGNYAFATGYGGYAHADYSFAAGYNAAATGNVSSAFGEGTLSASYVCMSLGRYNYTTPTSGTSWVTTDPVLIVGNGTSGNYRSNILEFYKNGNMGIRGSYYSFSDAKLKTDIKPLENSLKRIEQINGYNYHWRDKNVDESLQTGVLAQEIEKSFPELVAKNLKGELAVNYIGLIPHLIEAIKELKKEISGLRNDSSSSIAVCLCANGEPEKMGATPNPASNHVNITLTTKIAGNGFLQVTDSRGRVLKRIQISVHEGVNTINLSIPELSAGQYEVVASWGNGMKKQVSVLKQ